MTDKENNSEYVYPIELGSPNDRSFIRQGDDRRR
jgi:hypothetical protein